MNASDPVTHSCYMCGGNVGEGINATFEAGAWRHTDCPEADPRARSEEGAE